jgi:hypothetical protein
VSQDAIQMAIVQVGLRASLWALLHRTNTLSHLLQQSFANHICVSPTQLTNDRPEVANCLRSGLRPLKTHMVQLMFQLALPIFVPSNCFMHYVPVTPAPTCI